MQLLVSSLFDQLFLFIDLTNWFTYFIDFDRVEPCILCISSASLFVVSTTVYISCSDTFEMLVELSDLLVVYSHPVWLLSRLSSWWALVSLQ